MKSPEGIRVDQSQNYRHILDVFPYDLFPDSINFGRRLLPVVPLALLMACSWPSAGSDVNAQRSAQIIQRHCLPTELNRSPGEIGARQRSPEETMADFSDLKNKIEMYFNKSNDPEFWSILNELGSADHTQLRGCFESKRDIFGYSSYLAFEREQTREKVFIRRERTEDPSSRSKIVSDLIHFTFTKEGLLAADRQFWRIDELFEADMDLIIQKMFGIDPNLWKKMPIQNKFGEKIILSASHQVTSPEGSAVLTLSTAEGGSMRLK